MSAEDDDNISEDQQRLVPDSLPFGSSTSSPSSQHEKHGSKERVGLYGTTGSVYVENISAPHERTGSLASSVFNLVNTVIGGGLLSLPFAFKSSGVVIGILLLVCTALLGSFSLLLLAKCSELSASKTYMGVAREAFGKPGVVVTQLSVIVATFGTMISYMIIIGDMMSPLIGFWKGGTNDDYCSLVADRRFSISLSLLILIPLCIPRHINALRFTSIIAILSILYLVVIVVVRSGEMIGKANLFDCDGGTCASLARLSESLFRAIPIITFAYTCQMNIFPLISELKSPTKRRVKGVIFSSMGTCLCFYVLAGTFGYLTFYDTVKGNILLNYAVDDDFVMVGRLGVTIAITFSYPLMAQPCLANLDALFFPTRPITMLRHVLEVFATTGIAYTVAMLVSDVSIVFGLSGATASTMISFILPSLLFLRLDTRAHIESDESRHIKGIKRLFTLSRLPALCLLVLGSVFFIVSTVITLLPEDSTSSIPLCNATAV